MPLLVGKTSEANAVHMFLGGVKAMLDCRVQFIGASSSGPEGDVCGINSLAQARDG